MNVTDTMLTPHEHMSTISPHLSRVTSNHAFIRKDSSHHCRWLAHVTGGLWSVCHILIVPPVLGSQAHTICRQSLLCTLRNCSLFCMHTLLRIKSFKNVANRLRWGGLQFQGSPEKWFTRPHFQNNQSKTDWRCGRAPALQVWSPEFKPQSHQKKNGECITVGKRNCWEMTQRKKRTLGDPDQGPAV
jgi:hypothetical protein